MSVEQELAAAVVLSNGRVRRLHVLVNDREFEAAHAAARHLGVSLCELGRQAIARELRLLAERGYLPAEAAE